MLQTFIHLLPAYESKQLIQIMLGYLHVPHVHLVQILNSNWSGKSAIFSSTFLTPFLPWIKKSKQSKLVWIGNKVHQTSWSHKIWKKKKKRERKKGRFSLRQKMSFCLKNHCLRYCQSSKFWSHKNLQELTRWNQDKVRENHMMGKLNQNCHNKKHN